MNGIGHKWWHEMFDGQPALDPGPDLPGRNVQRKALERRSAKRFWKVRERLAGPGHGCKFKKRRQLIGLAPFVEFRHVIRADEIEPFHVRILFRVMPRRIDGVRDAAATQFLFVNFILRQAAQRKSKPSQTKFGRRGFIILFKGRSRGRNEKKPVQSQFLDGRLRDKQMAEMNGIERATE